MKNLSATRVLGITAIAFLFCTTVLTQHVLAQTGSSNPDASPAVTYKTQKDFAYKLIPLANNTWGYEIMVSKKVIVIQRTIPGVPGNDGFKTKEGAEKVAKLVIEKIQSGMIPPAVSLDELKNLNVL